MKWKRTYSSAIFAMMALMFLAVLSCGDDSKQVRTPYQNDLGIKPSTLAQIDSVHYTTIRWLQPQQDFGTIKYGDSVRLQFRFRNTGIHPLFISSVRTSCGCTVPAYSEGPVMPGEEDQLIAVFHSIGQASEVQKMITVRTNTSNGVDHVLTITGHVEKNE